MSPRLVCHLVSPTHPPPLMYIILLYDATLVDEGLSVYVVRGEGSSIEVNDLITHYVVTYDDEAYVPEATSVTYLEGLRSATVFDMP